jgi:hypothetical protein
MKAATLKQIKTELSRYPEDKMEAIILRLAKYKKDNKELLTYLLFEADDEDGYIDEVKIQIDEDFAKLNSVSLFLAKKTIRKALRTTDKYIKYSGLKQTEASLRIYFCYRMNYYKLIWKFSPAMENLYNRQIEKINKSISYLHEDLQFDFRIEMEDLLGIGRD